MNRLFYFCIAVFVTLSATHTNAQDSAFDELTMNGLASFQKLRKEYYIGALYLESSIQNEQDVITTPGDKRMDIRMLVDKWSPRRFAKEWTGAILLNNDHAVLEKLASQIQAFTSIPRNDLIKGDRITIDMAEGRHTTIYLNNHRVYRTIKNEFFYTIVNAWIGSKPPSSEFKQNILKLQRDGQGVELLTRYEEINYTDSRKRQTKAWSKSAENSNTANRSSSSFAPPGSATRSRPSNASNNQTQAKAAETKAKTKAKKEAAQKAQAEALAKAKADIDAAEAKAAAAIAALANAESEKARDEAMSKYKSNMYRSVIKNITFPKRSQQRGERGRVVIKVELDREGKIVNLSQQEPSEFSRLNNAAEKAFKVSEPFAPMPEDIEGSTFEFIFPINF
ncbi:MAG: TonB family protein [Pseudohongiellaceae bacterium]|jgi:TonB family protein